MGDIRTIGIVGGGQLGRMLVIPAKKLGYSVIVLDPTEASPAGQVADEQLVADFKDSEAIKSLAQFADLLTFEIEHVHDKALSTLEEQGKTVHPSPQTLSIIKDKLKQKEFLKSSGIPTAPFYEIQAFDFAQTKKEILVVAEKIGYPFMLKSRTEAYDGRGNAVVKHKGAIDKAIEKLKGLPLYIEEMVPFEKELAVMVARSIGGEIVTYPVVETIHKDNICDTVIAPARVPQKVQDMARKLAVKTMESLQGAGVFGIEMFLVKEDTVLVNEIAPRVHNSGHYTIEASTTSQFEQHIRAITGLPLGATDLLSKAVVMKNILGEKNGPGVPEGLSDALSLPGVSIHMYGKHESRPGRKMGHITVMGETVEECLEKAEKAREAITI
jgi:5-(carboxyamino)imidazole ribonucleotide synthase